MKELEKVQNISIASTLFILAIIIGLLTYKRPKNTFAFNTKTTLEKLTSDNYFVPLENVNAQNYKLVDIRSSYEFDKGHLENAINISTSEILKEQNLELFKNLKNDGKTVVLYGKNPEDVNAPLLILYQLGYDNVKLLNVENNYLQNKLITTLSEVEKSVADVSAFIKKSVKIKDSLQAVKEVKVVKVVAAPVKKVIVVEKKKKMPVEGGC